MRPGQNKRMRGRNNNGNRKGPNPLTRSYESNGPDVKIRGTAHHIGEKYLQLARDAQSSGDPVMAESYLQHAEHYFRLIAAAQQAQQQAQYGYRQPGGEIESDEEEFDDDFGPSLPDRFASPSERVTPPPPVPQPYADRQPPFPERQPQPYEARGERFEGGRQPQGERQPQEGRERPPYEPRERQYDNRRDRNGYPDRNGPQGERQDRSQERSQDRSQERAQQDRPQQDRSQQDRSQQDRPHQGGPDRGERQPREYDNRNFRNNRPPREQPPREPRQPVVDETSNGLPAFITAPVRAIADSDAAPELPSPVGRGPEADEDPGFHLRPRRRRRPKPDDFGGEPDKAPTPDVVGD